MPVLIDPIYASYVDDGRHQLLTNDTKYQVLADIIHIEYFHSIFSIGDLFIYTGYVFTWISFFFAVTLVLSTFTNWVFRRRT